MKHDGLIYICARRYMYFLQLRASVDIDDLMQEGRLAVMAAEKTFNPKKGAFSSWAWRYICKAMRRALGISTVDGKTHFRPDPASLDAPTSEDEEFTLLEQIADPDAWDGGEMAVAADDRRAVREAIEQLTGDQHTIATECLLCGRPLVKVAKELDITHMKARDAEYKAISNLRRILQPYAVEKALDSTTDFYRGKGAEAFQTSRSSAVEDIVFQRERRRESERKKLGTLHQ